MYNWHGIAIQLYEKLCTNVNVILNLPHEVTLNLNRYFQIVIFIACHIKYNENAHIIK